MQQWQQTPASKLQFQGELLLPLKLGSSAVPQAVLINGIWGYPGGWLFFTFISDDTFLHVFICLFIDRPTKMILLGNTGNLWADNILLAFPKHFAMVVRSSRKGTPFHSVSPLEKTRRTMLAVFYTCSPTVSSACKDQICFWSDWYLLANGEKLWRPNYPCRVHVW